MSHGETARPATGKVLFWKQPMTPTFSTTGTVAKINLRGDAIMLTDGNVFFLEKKANIKKVPAGARVAIIYENRDGLSIATSVKFLPHRFSVDPRLVL